MKLLLIALFVSPYLASNCWNDCWELYTECCSRVSGEIQECEPLKDACDSNNKYCDAIAQGKDISASEQPDYKKVFDSIFGQDSPSQSSHSCPPPSTPPAPAPVPPPAPTPRNQPPTVPTSNADYATMTWYSKAFNAGNYPKTACGLTSSQWKSSGPLVAVSENVFGVGDGQGAGPACGKCFLIKLIGNLDNKDKPALPELKVKVADLCPAGNGAPSEFGGNNEQWCVRSMSQKNSKGATVHFDLMVESLYANPEWAAAAYKGNFKLSYLETTC
jgi:hypothetical protein